MSSGNLMFLKKPSHQSEMPVQLASSALAKFGFPLVAVAGCAAIMALRVFPMLAHPTLGWDERVIFSAFYSGKGGILFLYPDYISLLQNIIFFLAFRIFPLVDIPNVLCYTAFTISACGLALFSLPIFRGVIQNDAARVVTCLLLAAMPLGNAAIATAPAYQNWTCLAVNCLISAAWLASYWSRAWRIPYALVFVAAICTLSQPLSVCFVPIYAAVAWTAKSPGDRRTQSVAALLIALSIIAAAEAFTLGREAAHAVTVPYVHLLAGVVRAVPFVLDRGLLESFIGAHWRGVVIDNFPPVAPAMAPLALYLVAAVVFGWLLRACWLTQEPEVRAFVATSLFIGLCLGLFILPALELARPGFSIGMLTGLSRYWFAQHFVAILMFCALACLEIFGHTRGSTVGTSRVEDGLHVGWAKFPTGWTAQRLAKASLVCIILSFWVLFANIGQSTQYDGGISREDLLKLASRQEAFLRWVSASEASGASGCLEQGPNEPEPRLRLTLHERTGVVAAPCQIFQP